MSVFNATFAHEVPIIDMGTNTANDTTADMAQDETAVQHMPQCIMAGGRV